jgi:hypothetical protein
MEKRPLGHRLSKGRCTILAFRKRCGTCPLTNRLSTAEDIWTAAIQATTKRARPISGRPRTAMPILKLGFTRTGGTTDSPRATPRLATGAKRPGRGPRSQHPDSVKPNVGKGKAGSRGSDWMQSYDSTLRDKANARRPVDDDVVDDDVLGTRRGCHQSLHRQRLQIHFRMYIHAIAPRAATTKLNRPGVAQRSAAIPPITPTMSQKANSARMPSGSPAIDLSFANNRSALTARPCWMSSAVVCHH